jgi:hypothetical protein
MNYELQKILAIECYRAIDIYEFTRLCLHIDQTLQDVEIKSSRDYNYRRITDASVFAFSSESVLTLKSRVTSLRATTTINSTLRQ